MTSDNPLAASETRDNQFEAGQAQLRDLLPFTIGQSIFAVFTDEVDATAEAKPFACLPRAPNSVVGIVCVRGRMLTVIDPAALLNRESREWNETLPCVIALRADEQLALAAETYRDTITILEADIERAPEASAADEMVLGKVTYASEDIIILNAPRLFSRAVQRRDRRRRRF